MIRVLLIEDQLLLREALARLMRLEPDLEVAVADSASAGLAAAARIRPDVVLLDIQLPDRDGLEIIASLRAFGCRIVMLTAFGRPGYLQRALASGAVGFVLKDATPEQLTESIRRVAAGLRVVDPVLAEASLLSGPSTLTAREAEILAASADGGTVADLAAKFGLSEGTVRNHLSAAIGKTGARRRGEAIRIARERGWL